MNKYERLYNRAAKKNPRARWFDTAIVPLAVDLQEATGMTSNASGCFGLRCECRIVLENEREKRFLTITPDITDKGTLKLYYDTGEIKTYYPAESIGALNGFNNISKRLPDTLDKIIPLFHTVEKMGGEK